MRRSFRIAFNPEARRAPSASRSRAWRDYPKRSIERAQEIADALSGNADIEARVPLRKKMPKPSASRAPAFVLCNRSGSKRERIAGSTEEPTVLTRASSRFGFCLALAVDCRGDRGSARRVRIQRWLVRAGKLHRSQQPRRRACAPRGCRAAGDLPGATSASGLGRPGVSAGHRSSATRRYSSCKSSRCTSWRRASSSSRGGTFSVPPIWLGGRRPASLGHSCGDLHRRRVLDRTIDSIARRDDASSHSPHSRDRDACRAIQARHVCCGLPDVGLFQTALARPLHESENERPL